MNHSTSSSLLFGGTFDPPHHGHLIVARSAAEAVGADRVILMPAAQSPHKQGLTVATSPASDRLAMCRAAVAGDPQFEVSTLELDRPAPSYTYDTATELFQQGFSCVRWLIGADQLLTLPRWHRAAELVQQIDFVIAARPGSELDFDKLPEPFRRLKSSVVTIPRLEISSTDIRQRVAGGKSIRYLVPPAVEQFIIARGLYRQPR